MQRRSLVPKVTKTPAPAPLPAAASVLVTNFSSGQRPTSLEPSPAGTQFRPAASPASALVEDLLRPPCLVDDEKLPPKLTPAAPPPPAPSAMPGPSWVSTVVAGDDEDDEEELAPLTPTVTKTAPATPSAAVINSCNAACEVDKDEDLEMDMAPKMLLAASNGHGLSSGGPVATTPSPHVHCPIAQR
jgi:hypothetical protein